MTVINLIESNNSISLIDNSIDISVNETISSVNITGEVVHNIELSEPIYDITLTQTGKKGEPGNNNLFIQDTEPEITVPSLWIQTENGQAVTMWLVTEDI